MLKLPRLLLVLGAALVLAVSLSLVRQAAQAADAGRTATLADIVDKVFFRADANAAETQATNGQVLQVGSSVRTGAASSVQLNLSEGTVVRMKENSQFTLTALNQDASNPFTQLTMAVGKLWIILSGGTAQVETPAGVAAVRGSYMAVSYNPALNEMKVMCLETKQTCTVTINGVTYQLQMGQQLSTPPADHPRIEAITSDCGEQKEWLKYNPESNQFLDQNCVVIHDRDGDDVPDQFDNCPDKFNSDQVDNDHNGVGDACQPNPPHQIETPTPAPACEGECPNPCEGECCDCSESAILRPMDILYHL